ncbi:hypothetical protein CC80DRAFT_30895 [Byssothecium circinans]|uniref:Uncharacterized protein n=1 Tax=Byssothecium circinans TaxID=147558 RepID=A0A6A5U1F5_9PLEO|nr:hypothetical protein CC80DRAFT_30895 [Byssothecium circinans]
MLRKAKSSNRIGEVEPLGQRLDALQFSRSKASSSETTSRVPVPSALDDLDFSPNPLELPSQSECIAHLKLLHAFAKLRHEVGNQSGLFGIRLPGEEGMKNDMDMPEDLPPEYSLSDTGTGHNQNVRSTPCNEALAMNDLADRVREKSWTVFVTKAVDRFEKWWSKLASKSTEFPYAIRTVDFVPSGSKVENVTGLRIWPERFVEVGEGLTESMSEGLPPLDILMVWHAYMLNPRTYLEDCMRMNKHMPWRTLFPWKLIHDSIDSDTLEYDRPEEAKNAFAMGTSINWNWRDDLRLKMLTCPRCGVYIEVPYTRPPHRSSTEAMEAFLDDTGYAGRAFVEQCPCCQLHITHESLRVGKFISDVDDLWLKKTPLEPSSTTTVS